jgi:hypothetical protein
VAFLCAAMRGIARAWRPRICSISPGLTLNVSVVFTHQSPYVRWPSDRCELADLLIAFVDKTSSPGWGYATLIQAKQADGSPVKLSTRSEQTQFHLLHKRPVFEVQAKSAPTSVVLPATRRAHDMALLYGTNPPKNATANPPPWSSHRWQTDGRLASAPVVNQVSPVTCLADTLVAQLQGNAGWDFSLPPSRSAGWSHFASSPRDDWSMLVNYLLDATFKKPLKSLRKAMGQPRRGRHYPLYFQTRSPYGNTMFFYSDPSEEGEAYPPLDWIGDAADESDWFEVINSPLYELGGSSGIRSGDPGKDDFEPDNGPISAIVFEIIKKRG